MKLSNDDYMVLSTKRLIFQSKHIKDIKTSVLYVNNQANLVTLDYEMDVSEVYPELEAEHKYFYSEISK